MQKQSIHVQIPIKLKEALDTFVEDKGMTITGAVRKALEKYLEEQK